MRDLKDLLEPLGDRPMPDRWDSIQRRPVQPLPESHRAGSRRSSPRASACANASDSASSATAGSPVNASKARQIAGPSCR